MCSLLFHLVVIATFTKIRQALPGSNVNSRILSDDTWNCGQQQLAWKANPVLLNVTTALKHLSESAGERQLPRSVLRLSVLASL